MVLIYLVCTITLLICPLLRVAELNKARFYDDKLRAYRLSLIQKHYPELRNLSWREIEQEYSVKRLYDQIR